MLREISIQDLGSIAKAQVEFGPGLTVLTGETGAGKTMILSSLRLLCGYRADSHRVRDGAPQTVVEGSVLLDSQHQDSREYAQEAGAEEDENGEFLLARTVSAQGRSRAYLGGRSVPAQVLHNFTAPLITIHGQHDQIALLQPARQREVLDSFDPELTQLSREYTQAFHEWRDIYKDYKKRQVERRELAQEIDRLRFAIDEINSVDPQLGEEEALQQSISQLQDVDILREHTTTALLSLDGDEENPEGAGVSDLLGRAAHALEATEDAHLGSLARRITELSALLADISVELGSFLSTLPTDPHALDKALQRQQDVQMLTRKYAADIEGVIEWRDNAIKKLESIDISPEAMEQLKEKVRSAQKKRDHLAKKLRARREVVAKLLGEKVSKELHGLAMPKVRFEVQLKPLASKEDGRPTYSEYGTEDIEFALGYGSPKPLAVAASGGELSRVMLALELISAQHSSSTIIFDEVDAGVGGRAAVEIGRRLAQLAQDTQVIVVTHLPQVAAYATEHLHISKNIDSHVRSLSREERIEELARMLAGLDDTDTGRAHAQELFTKAQREVESFTARLDQ